MDGATNMNVSNAPPAITAGSAKKLKKTFAKDAAAAEKHVAQVSNSLKSAEKDEGRAEKVSPSSLFVARVLYTIVTATRCRRPTAPSVYVIKPCRRSTRLRRCSATHSTSTTWR